MAQHVIYDEKGRIKEIQSEKEYSQSHGCLGCLNGILYIAGAILVIIFLLWCVFADDKNSSSATTRKTESVQQSSQSLSNMGTSSHSSDNTQENECYTTEMEDETTPEEYILDDSQNDQYSSNANDDVIDDMQLSSISESIE